MNKSRARVWALCGAVLFVSACGGGGDSGASSAPSTPTPPPPPPPAQEELLVAGFGFNGPTETLVVVDPAQPTPLRLSTLVDQHLEVSHLTFDTTGRRITLGSSTAVYYVRNGRLFQVSLRKNQSNQPRQISSVADACSVDDWHPFSYSTGDDGWVEVTTSGADGSCFPGPDNRKVFVRRGTPATDLPTSLPDGVRITSALPDPASAALLGFIAYDTRAVPSKLALYSPTLTHVSDVVGGTGRLPLELLSFRPGGPLTTSAYAKSGSSVVRLDWSASSATLSSLSMPFSITVDIDGNAECLSDDAAMYCVSGFLLRRLDAAGTVSTLATMANTDGSSVTLRGLTAGHLVVQQSTDTSSGQVFAVPKLGGTPLALAPAFGQKYVVGVHGNEVVYSTLGSSRVIRRIGIDGSNDRLITILNSGYPMPVSNPTVPSVSVGTLDTVMWCDVPSAGHCTNGTIRSYDLQSGTTTALGTLSHSSADIFSLYVSGWGFSGRPTVLTASAALMSTPGFVTDFYLAHPGTANSLVRLTTNIP
ncbi:hypothetical protein [Piscinibacter gummiphilus]|uniref:Lipoprotein n=1 Tax=Piscinibacter gummiphilus TaxID=946333 RepID=A0ABZ0CXX8_9BURK|nr:hypothetical protein [Piscinibacter gummiphilus]WOB07334.1 hypothetical protein RXV79_20745 [Piscinibacter gummiphilus]